MLKPLIASIAILIAILDFNVSKAATPEQSQIDSYAKTLGRVNRYSPLEGAGSHGSLGFNIGMGLDVTSQIDASPIVDDQFFVYSGQPSPSTLVIPKVHFIKGSGWPIDFGLSLGSAMNGRLRQFQGYGQWTVWEGFRLPELALRFSASKLLGLKTTSISTVGLEAAFSYHFMRFFNIYATAGGLNQKVSGRFSKAEGTLFLEGGDPDIDATTTWFEPVYALGLQIQIWSPFITTSFEAKPSTGDGQGFTYAAKISMGV